MRTSPPPRPRRDAAAFPPLVIPGDTPDYTRRVLAMLDETITREATMRADPDQLARMGANDGERLSDEDSDEPPLSAAPAGDARLLIADRMHRQADGAAAFFLFHYLRLLSDQVASRAAGGPAPRQTWATPNWSPATPPSPAPTAARGRGTVPAPASRGRADRPTGQGNIIVCRALLAHGSR
jgi:hypothetical protein